MGGLTALAALVVAYTMIASKLDRWWITAPMVFVAAGAILGPGGLAVLPFALGDETVLTITELTLALLLFADASTVRLDDVEGDSGLPRRLLFAGLPMTIAIGALLAYLVFPGAGWAAAALIATILAPTDAALGLAVVTNKAVPVRIRRALNVESGLNDGIATPFVTLFVAAVAAEEALGGTAWGWEAVKQIGLAIVAAIVVGHLGGRLLSAAAARGWTAQVSEQIAILALALLAYEGSVAIGGNGFIAAFLGGLLFGAATRGRLRAPVQFTETLGLATSFLVWALFGALFVGTLAFSVRPILYAILSLTVIRLVPVAIALLGTRLRPATVAFMGWFGPRGLASVVFLLIALEEIEHAENGGLLVAAVTWTILLSVVAHGVSASGLAAAYGKSIARAGDVAEKLPAGEPPIRVRDLAGRLHHSSSSHSSASKP
ncbi:sodium:proton antiporter [Actinoplanes sp. TBRC 11911]|uniref:cation:proton antiporter domain-containing protein n=1 Tax=Actinoplanes sp. TBRC 11911 TaxID=2729386 RepID=UPI00145FB535|nr:cation:proton antiporter [Actinoplanes sp. TBRC 11911]NMO57643.1 sodium:proton antiporter [Actinoplanes sp. TBRC 11911]